MLYDMDYTNPEDIRPLFFRASLKTASCGSLGGTAGRCGMILQALTDYYRVLEQAGKIDAPAGRR
ncbi:MAG: hypothetical protein ACLTYN_13790 [Dysosmobacter welbionis]